MAVFEITAPDGKTYEIEGANAQGALAALQKHLGSAAAAPAAAPPAAPTFDAMGNPTGSAPDPVQASAMPYGEQMARVGSAIDKGVRLAANGATFGLADKFAGGMDALTGRASSYDAGVRAQRAETEAIRQAAPGPAAVAEMVGGLGTGAGLIKSGITLATRTGPRLLPRVLGYGTEGAAYGAAHGAGNTYSDRARDYIDAARNSGGIGLLTGGALPLAGAAAGTAYRAGSAFLGPRIEGASRGASSMLRTAAQADEAGLRALPSMGPDAMLVDAGPAMLGLGQGAGTGTGAGRTELVNALRTRDSGTGQRLAQALDANLGPAPVPSRLEAGLEQSRQSLGPIYGQVLDDAGVAAAHGAPPLNVEALAQNLSSIARVERGPAQRAARQVLGMLERNGRANPGVIAPEAPTFSSAPAAVIAREEAPNAQSLAEFLASKGGIGPDAELEAIGALRHTVNVEGLGRRKLVRQGGLPLDYAREAAEEAGYLQGNYRGTSTVNDLLDALDAEMRGNKLYPGGVQGSNKRASAARSEREQYEYDKYKQGLEEDAAAAGYPDRPFAPQNTASVAPSNLDNSPDALLNTRQAIDGMLATEADPNTIRVLTQARKAVDDELANVPGLKNVDAQFAELARQSTALQRGSQLLDSGKTAIRPVELADEIARGALPQGAMVGPSAAPLRIRQGARAEIDRIVGTNVNDLNALERKLGTPQDWNAQKMATVFGDEPTARVAEALMNNRRFRQSYQDIVQNSQTAQRMASASAMEGGKGGNVPHDTTMTGLGLKAVNLVAKAISGASSATTKDEVGRLLASQGPAVQRIAQELLRSAQTAAANSRALSNVVGSQRWIGALAPIEGRGEGR